MVAATFINGATAFGLLVAVLYCAGNLDEALDSPTGQPFLAIFAQAVGSDGGATGMVSFLRQAVSLRCCRATHREDAS